MFGSHVSSKAKLMRQALIRRKVVYLCASISSRWAVRAEAKTHLPNLHAAKGFYKCILKQKQKRVGWVVGGHMLT